MQSFQSVANTGVNVFSTLDAVTQLLLHKFNKGNAASSCRRPGEGVLLREQSSSLVNVRLDCTVVTTSDQSRLVQTEGIVPRSGRATRTIAERPESIPFQALAGGSLLIY